jgi:CDP-paratose 2-epimerase
MRSDRETHGPALGLLEWFQVGDRERVEQVLADARALGITEIRTGLSWADFWTPEGPAWYDWLLPRISEQARILPCFTYTPPSEGIVPKTSSPPREPKKFADFLDVAITRYGEHFDHVELWNEPNGLVDWDWRLDPGWNLFGEMIRMAAYWAHQRGKKTVLGGMCPVDQNWLNFMCERGVLEHIDVVGVHGFPGTWEFDWVDWTENLRRVREVLDRHAIPADIWITEVGYSTWRHDDFTQLLHFKDTMEAPVDRVYWYSVRDLRPTQAHQEGYRQDERHYHLGLKTADGQPKLLYRVLESDGIAGVEKLAELTPASLSRLYTTPMATRQGESATPTVVEGFHLGSEEYALITGGAGFVGTNLADRLLREGKRVLIYDNLSRPGVEKNLRWLCETHGERVQVEIADVRDPYLLREAARGADAVFHFAAQVAVTTSLKMPRHDFDVNALGTLNLLEALRDRQEPPPLVFTSTNKVYGALDHIGLRETATRWEPEDARIRSRGVKETTALHFHSPYGCSKGTADQYVLEYAETFGIPAVVFRMSCIYGPHQFGTEDQGWVAHFLIQALRGEPVTIYGDGKQVRDILFVDDLVEALLTARDQAHVLAGRPFNVGGGQQRAISLLELIRLIANLTGTRPDIDYCRWRPADQRYYVSDFSAFSEASGWSPRVENADGLEQLYHWLRGSHTSRRVGTSSSRAGRSSPPPRRSAPAAALRPTG